MKEAALRGLAAARDAAGVASPALVDLHSPDVVVVICQWRQCVELTEPGGEQGKNKMTCGVTFMSRALCDVRSKGIAPVKPLAKAPLAAERSGVGVQKRDRSWSGNGEVGGSIPGGDGVVVSAEWNGGRRGQVAKAAKRSGGDLDDAPGERRRGDTSKSDAPEQQMSDAEALRLLDRALARRVASGLIASSKKRELSGVELGEVVLAESERATLVRLVHGTGDGFDGLTVELVGPAILLEQHRQWASYQPLLAALVTRLGSEIPMFMKRRWSRDPAARGGVHVSGSALPPMSAGFDLTDGSASAAPESPEDTHEHRVVVREPGTDGLRFGLWLTGEEHVGVFSDSRLAREFVRSVSRDKRVLNLFSYTGGFGVAASAGGARCSHNVDSKAPCLNAARTNYALNGLEVDPDGRSFRRSDVIRFLTRTAQSAGTRYDVIVVDPPPRFSRKSDWAYEAELHTGQLLALCVGVAAPEGATLVAGVNALTVSDERFVEMIAEAEALSNRTLTVRRWIGAGEDFPRCPYRPTARFAEIAVGEATGDGGEGRSLAEELAMRDEGGDEDDDEDGEASNGEASNGEASNGEASNGEASNGGGKFERTDAAAATSSHSDGELRCQLCTGQFPSRNKLFKHLRCLKNPCGAWIEAQGGITAAAVLLEEGGTRVPRFDPPEPERVKEPKKAKKAKVPKVRAPKEVVPNELWIGGFTAEHATAKALKHLLWRLIPGSSGIAQPEVRLVVRRGWRDKSRRWIGYGFVQFRDEAEARQAMGLLDGMTTPEGLRMKAAPSVARADDNRIKAEPTTAEPGDAAAPVDDADEDEHENDEEVDVEAGGSANQQSLEPGEDPSTERVLRAWPRATLSARAKAAGMTVQALVAAAANPTGAHAALFAPEERRLAGAVVPAALYATLLDALDNARWPPVSHRRKVASERYLVVTSDIRRGGNASDGVVDPYLELKTAAAAIMAWADPSFKYDHLAITRNFVGSPHVDREDKSYQYAVSLGTYGEGGELVVESEDGKTRWVVDTRGKIARVDGRFVHWVRGYDRRVRKDVEKDVGNRAAEAGGDEGRGKKEGNRYSVIYYINKPRYATAKTFAVEEDWKPAGGGGGTRRNRIIAGVFAACGILMAARSRRVK